MRNRDDVAWAAGLFEGEGCFTATQQVDRPTRRVWSRPMTRLAMVDRDVVERFRDVVGYGKVVRLAPKEAHHQVQWLWRADRWEYFQATVAMFWPWLGERRRARALDIVRNTRPTRGAPGRRTHCPQGHEYSPENTRMILKKAKGWARSCKECHRAGDRARHWRVRHGGDTQDDSENTLW